MNSIGIISTVAGSGYYGYAGDGGPATAANLNRPYSVAFAPSNDFYIADTQNNVVRKVIEVYICFSSEFNFWPLTQLQVNSIGIISIVAGNTLAGLMIAGPATAATLYMINAVGISPSGDIYTSDNYNTVRKVHKDTF